MNLPTNVLLLNPAGTYSFVGKVSGVLAYMTADGQVPSTEQLTNAQIAGPRIAGLRSRSFPTPAAAAAFAAALGIQVAV